MKTKYAKDTLQAFKKIVSRKNTTENFELIKEQNMGKRLKNFTRRKTLKFTQQRVKQKLHLQRDHISLQNIFYVVAC